MILVLSTGANLDLGGGFGIGGWTPVPALVEVDGRIVNQVVDWISGNGTKPAIGLYVGPDGLVEDPADATDVKGETGEGLPGANAWTAIVANVEVDGRVVEQVIDWINGSGEKPAVGMYVGPDGFVALPGQATDKRGPAGIDSPEVVRDKLTDLENDERLPVEAVKGAVQVVESESGVLNLVDGKGRAITSAGVIRKVEGTPLYDIPTIGVGGWIPNAAAALSISNEVLYDGKPSLKIDASAGNGYPVLRLVIPAHLRDMAKGKLTIPVFIPNGTADNIRPVLAVSSASDASLPSNSDRKEFTWPQYTQKPGQWSHLSVHLQATADTSPILSVIAETVTGTWSSGTTNMDALTQVIFLTNFNVEADVKEIYLGTPMFGEWSTPVVMFVFDGAQSDASHARYVLPELEKRGFKATFAFQGQGLSTAAQQVKLSRILAGGHTVANEGMNHTNYGVNPTNLIADFYTANTNYAAAGSDGSNAFIFASPANAIRGWGSGSPGVKELSEAGVQFVRAGSRMLAGVNETVLPMGPVMIDLKDGAYLTKALNAALLHGEAILFSGHSVVASGATGLQINLADFITLLDAVEAAVSNGKAFQMSIPEYIQSRYFAS